MLVADLVSAQPKRPFKETLHNPQAFESYTAYSESAAKFMNQYVRMEYGPDNIMVAMVVIALVVDEIVSVKMKSV